ncbi:DUF2157 domain-containing membrane protein [Campylobacter blaseri]|uniref:DUF2157 domain-containing protein n=1 Tax=Campylobacter blaseri TaxID=2042961 RepID=A0A2P8R2P4_9BACT|nr:DUF2157 domain-containing protein [Campylobacter blaseri]PSM52761.1 hypothetical protein CQ405_03285 [Campylobacter blaseri]PSM54409.1 hypothetical protein CRN67_03285 [Campylobacter blaseri]QKF86071.1 DUF2157 domain-containing membrane protein [Campylobacter blaseri]
MIEKIFLQKEIKKWLDEEIISKEQAISILDRYGLSYKEDERNFNIFSILGCLLIGVSLIILIGNNWNNIPPFIRVTSLIFATFAIQIGAYIRLKKYNSSNLFFLGNLVFGASIILIAQIYHLGTHMPNGVFLWAIGSFLIAIFLSNKWVNLQSMLLATLWCLLEIDSSYPYAFWLFLITSAFIFYRYGENGYLFRVFLLNIIWFLPYTLYYFTINENYIFYDEYFLLYMIFTTYILFLFVNLILKNRANLYLNISNSMMVKIFYLFSFLLISEDFYEKITLGFLDLNTLFYILVFLVLSLTFLVKEKRYFIYTAIFLLLIFALKVANFGYLFWVFVAINFLLFIFYCFIVYKGIMEDNLGLYRLGISSILIFIFIHYFSLISQDYVTTSIFFFICASLMLIFVKIFKKIKRV